MADFDGRLTRTGRIRLILRRAALATGLFASSLMLSVAAAQVAERPIPGDPIDVEGGRLEGKLLPSGVRAYFGVPFAAPPVRELRWRDPQPVQAWSGTRHADRFAPECIQTLRAHDINHYFGEEATSEDCLYLNVWAPPQASPAGARPVVVWIYGGGFTIGSAAMANYHGETLARKGVVYVSIAYRVGALGFLAHPALTAESARHSSGNQGILDQIAALKWIQRNIARFGGDPNNVTIMGQSAGAMSVSVLQASPLAKGLFHRAVGMSGGVFGSASPGAPPTLAEAEAGGRRFQEHLAVAALSSMRDLPADRILAAQLKASLRYGPIVDGHVLPAAPAQIFASGKQNDVPLMVGFTRDESFSELARTTTLQDWQQSARAMFGRDASALLALYPAKDDAEARRAATAAGRDSTIALQMRQWAQAQVATGKAPVFAYLFSRVHPYVPGVTFADHDPSIAGAYHTGDVPYWLGTLDSLNLFRKTREWSDSDRALSEAMSDALAAFAKNGNPNVAEKQDWPAYRADREQIREFGETIRAIKWPNVRQLEFFAANLSRMAAAQTAPAVDEPAIDSRPVLEDRYPERRITFPGNVVSFADITFSALTGYRPLTLDLYRPSAGSTPLPLVIYVHGGGWQAGHTRHSGAFANWPRVLASIAARGYVVASVEYRLSGEAPFPAAIQDVKAAIRWLRAHAQQFGIDSQRAVIWGGSAGGQLAALAGAACGVAALDPPGAGASQRPEPGAVRSEPTSASSAASTRPESDCVQGVVAWYGIFDFAALASGAAASAGANAADASAAPSRYLGCALGKCSQEVLAAASAAHYLDRGDPPVLLIHGVNDKTVPLQQSRAYLRTLQAKGISAELIELSDVDHSFIGPTPEATRVASLRALETSVELIERTVGKR